MVYRFVFTTAHRIVTDSIFDGQKFVVAVVRMFKDMNSICRLWHQRRFSTQ